MRLSKDKIFDMYCDKHGYATYKNIRIRKQIEKSFDFISFKIKIRVWEMIEDFENCIWRK